MSNLSEQICKYNQSGFFRFKERCRKTHEHIMCKNHTTCNEKDCIKRHPKLCINMNKAEGCRFKEDCAYRHNDSNSTQQKEINEAVAVVVSKHNDEIKVLQDKVKLY